MSSDQKKTGVLAFDANGSISAPQGQTILLESMTVDAQRAWNKTGGTIVLSGCGFELRIDNRCYLPDMKRTIDAALVVLLANELELFAE